MIVFSDLHLHNWNDFHTPTVNGLSQRFYEQLDVLTKVFETAVNNNTQNIVFLGDWYQRWDSVSTNIASVSTAHLYDLLEASGVHLYMMAGNHDMPNKNDASVNTLTQFSGHPQITVISQPTDIFIEDHNCAFVPYNQDPVKVVSSAIELEGDWLFAHMDVVGAQAYIDGYIQPTGIDLNNFGGYDGGTLGHYHMHQSFLTREQQEFSYVGSPIQLHRVDAGNVRGVISVEAYQSTFIPIPSPQIHLVEVPSLCQPTTTRNGNDNVLWSEVFSQIPGDPETDYYYVRALRSQSVEVQKMFQERHMKVRVIPINEERETSDRSKYWAGHEGASPLQRYLQQTGPGELDRSVLLKFGEYYMSESKE